MKCEQCNHEAVKIKKNHFCPSCGRRVNNDGGSNIHPIPKNTVAPPVAPRQPIAVDINENNILNLKENQKSHIIHSPVASSTNHEKIEGTPVKEAPKENIPQHIKNIIEKHTEPNNSADSVDKRVVETVPSLSLKSNVSKNIVLPNKPSVNKNENQVKSPENVFASKKSGVFWDKPVEKKSMMPSKKEKTLQKMLILVVALNALVILGIVYLLLT